MKPHAKLASAPNLGGMTDGPLGTQPRDAIQGSALYAGMAEGSLFETLTKLEARCRAEAELGPVEVVLRWTPDGRVKAEVVRVAPVEAEPSCAA